MISKGLAEGTRVSLLHPHVEEMVTGTITDLLDTQYFIELDGGRNAFVPKTYKLTVVEGESAKQPLKPPASIDMHAAMVEKLAKQPDKQPAKTVTKTTARPSLKPMPGEKPVDFARRIRQAKGA